MTDAVITVFKGAYGYLSNFHVEKDGLTVEHRFQAAKAVHPGDARWIMTSARPAIAKQRGQNVHLRSDWEDVKEDIMLDLLRAKFAPGSELAGRLVETYPAELQEGNWWGDQYWGVSLTTGQGQNRLGVLLMVVRTELLEAQIEEEETYEALKTEVEEGDW
jgi:hypothetical protein